MLWVRGMQETRPREEYHMTTCGTHIAEVQACFFRDQTAWVSHNSFTNIQGGEREVLERCCYISLILFQYLLKYKINFPASYDKLKNGL